MKRSIARAKAIQTLYQIDIAKVEWEEALNNVLQGQKSIPFLDNSVAGVIHYLPEIDKVIEASLHNWRLERLAHIDRAILRLAVYELRYVQRKKNPEQVVINEAVELAKTYSTEQSSKFINGVLATVVKQGESKHGHTGD